MKMYALPSNDVQIGLRITRELKEEIDKLAKEGGCTTSAMIRSMLYGAVYSAQHPELVEAVRGLIANDERVI